ncbi:MAG: hypothetical protein K0R69_1271 [Clostridia bacterium]|jgi:hypothetical protein|nr:hypothetical protein [Clostridia bacterium]
MEIDHIYICTDKKAPAGDLLIEFGLVEGSSNTHPGQGTANRRFFFQNMMLELLWVENIDEVKSERTQPMRLYERCLLRTPNTSPFGMAFRPTMEKDEEAPFPTWDYRPIYLPDFLKIQVARDTQLCEPMYFYLFFAQKQEIYLEEKKEPSKHKIPLKEVTAVKMYTNQQSDLSQSAKIINKLPNLSIEPSSQNLIELEFDHGIHKQLKDFRPDLPLLFRW